MRSSGLLHPSDNSEKPFFSRMFSLSLFLLITSLQKSATAFLRMESLSKSTMVVFRDKSGLLKSWRLLLCVFNFRHMSVVCCAECRSAPHSWLLGCFSARILYSYSPKHSCPVRNWVILDVGGFVQRDF